MSLMAYNTLLRISRVGVKKEPSWRGTGASRNAPPGLKDRAERGGSLQEDIGEEGSKPEAEFHSHSREDQG